MTVLEFLLTAGMLFLVVTTLRWIVAGDSPLAEALHGWRRSLFLAGLFGGAIAVVITESMRRRTAGHMNPAVTVGLWLLGQFPGRSVLPFVAAQLSGSLAGVVLARLVWGAAAARAPVSDAAIAPDPRWTAGAVFAAEAGVMAAIMLVVALLVTDARRQRHIPAAVGAAIAAVIILLGPRSGGSVNPARQLGPALFSGQTRFLWIYLVAPIIGSCVAGGLTTAARLLHRWWLSRGSRPHPVASYASEPVKSRLCPSSRGN